MEAIEAVVEVVKANEEMSATLDVYDSWFETLIGKTVTIAHQKKKKTIYVLGEVEEFESGEGWLVLLAVLASAIAAFFYLRVIVVMFFSEPAPDGPSVVVPSGFTTHALPWHVSSVTHGWLAPLFRRATSDCSTRSHGTCAANPLACIGASSSSTICRFLYASLLPPTTPFSTNCL